MARGRGAVRDRPGSAPARRRVPAGRRRARRDRGARSRARGLRAHRREIGCPAGGRAPRPAADPTDVPVHGHRRLDPAPRDARQRQVEEAPRPSQRAARRADRRLRRRGRPADRRRLLRHLPDSQGGARSGDRHSARPRGRDRRRPTSGSARTPAMRSRTTETRTPTGAKRFTSPLGSARPPGPARSSRAARPWRAPAATSGCRIRAPKP